METHFEGGRGKGQYCEEERVGGESLVLQFLERTASFRRTTLPPHGVG